MSINNFFHIFFPHNKLQADLRGGNNDDNMQVVDNEEHYLEINPNDSANNVEEASDHDDRNNDGINRNQRNVDDDEQLNVANKILHEIERNETNANVFHNDIEDDANEVDESGELSYAEQVDVRLEVLVNHEAAIQRDEAIREHIYPGINLTKDESDLLIMSFAIRHNLSYTALQDLLELINCHVPVKLNSSKYTFLKSFPASTDFRTYYYCSDCTIMLNFRPGFSYTRCTSCHKVYLQN
ncbi:uncharacterized protein LOC107981412 [Nasonia vitripennis]|uniref:Uncharacterized protein n=1 Tax=Nasonia vitripennis TaxID=7425 RepID=A0A7M7QIM3_NASVI|nr:uncharacterized protein LOC107981412 [Nasonia vitripennis]